MEVGTLLNPTTPLVGFASSTALFQARLSGWATTRGPSSTIGVARSAVVTGRMIGGVVVIALGPSWTTDGVDRIGVGAMELVISLGVDVGTLTGIVERDRVVVLDRAVLLEVVFERFEEGGGVGLDSCPRSLLTSATDLTS